MNTQRLIESLEEAPIGDGDLRGEPFRVLAFSGASCGVPSGLVSFGLG